MQYKKHGILIRISLLALSCLHPLMTFADEYKNFEVAVLGTDNNSPAATISRRVLNTKKKFNSVINQNTYVFLVGNNNYSPDSFLSPLTQCHSDAELLKQIFINCCHIPEKNIYDFKDLTIKEWKDYFKFFKSTLDRNSMAIIFYSGHGGQDGSLMFVNGGRLPPESLRAQVNSYPNDTILMLDACYSGNNDGPVPVKGRRFKANCLRIYASLAHQQAKEIIYENEPFFAGITAFYKDVLGLEEIKGNGYFSALIGLFFGEYKLDPFENISFSDMVFNLIQNHSSYIEYTKSFKKKSEGFISGPIVLSGNGVNENQLPKIVPGNEKDVDFLISSHCYIIYQRNLSNPRPTANHFSASLSPGMIIPAGPGARRYTNGFETLFTVNYNIFCNPGILGFGITGGVGKHNILETSDLRIERYPLTAALNLKYYVDFDNPLFLLADLDAGAVFTQLVSEGFPSVSYFYYLAAPAIGLGWSFSEHLNIAAAAKINILPYFYRNKKQAIAFSVEYYFSPGIYLIYNL